MSVALEPVKSIPVTPILPVIPNEKGKRVSLIEERLQSFDSVPARGRFLGIQICEQEVLEIQIQKAKELYEKSVSSSEKSLHYTLLSRSIIIIPQEVGRYRKEISKIKESVSYCLYALPETLGKERTQAAEQDLICVLNNLTDFETHVSLLENYSKLLEKKAEGIKNRLSQEELRYATSESAMWSAL